MKRDIFHWKKVVSSSDKIEPLTDSELQNGVLRNSLVRLYRESDFDTLVNYLMENWNLGYNEAGVSHKVASELYAHYTLAESQIVIVSKLDNGGFASYQSALIDDDSERQLFHKKKFEELLVCYPNMKEYYDTEDEFEKIQKQYSNNYLQILIVGKKHQGLNIGKNLFGHIKNIEHQLWFKNRHHPKADLLRELSVYTTTDCNVGFYEKQKGELIYRNNSIPDGNKPAEALIFQYPIIKYSWEL